MSSDAPAKPPKKKLGKMKFVLIGIGTVALGGGGVAAGMWAAAGTGGAKHEEIDTPKLVARDGVTADPDAGGPKGLGKFDHRRYKPTYVPLEQSFTANLRDSDAVIQLALGVATYYDERVPESITSNDTPIRSAVLLALADQDVDEISTPAGKKALQKTLKSAVNDVLVAKTGFAGVDDVYFTSFIIQ